MTSARRRPPSPDLIDPRLASAASHPTRLHLLSALDVRAASPRELAEELGEPLNNVSYHIEKLKELNCVELVAKKPKHGSRVIEHFYRATRMPLHDNEAWDQLDNKSKWAVVTSILRAASRDLNESFAAGVFMDPDDNHLSRTPLVVDATGWDEVRTILDETLERLLDVRINVAARTRQDKAAQTMAIKVQMFQFRSPDPGSKEPGSGGF